MIRKFAYNILKLIYIQLEIHRPNTELMDILCDNLELLKKYIFKEIASLS